MPTEATAVAHHALVAIRPVAVASAEVVRFSITAGGLSDIPHPLELSLGLLRWGLLEQGPTITLKIGVDDELNKHKLKAYILGEVAQSREICNGRNRWDITIHHFVDIFIETHS